MKKRYNPCGCTHTHTHTHTCTFRKWSKGGSREHRDVAILPHDCE